jgi:hypothetical protein
MRRRSIMAETPDPVAAPNTTENKLLTQSVGNKADADGTGPTASLHAKIGTVLTTLGASGVGVIALGECPDTVQLDEHATFVVQLYNRSTGAIIPVADITNVGTVDLKRYRAGVETIISAGIVPNKADGIIYTTQQIDSVNFQDFDTFVFESSGIIVNIGGTPFNASDVIQAGVVTDLGGIGSDVSDIKDAVGASSVSDEETFSVTSGAPTKTMDPSFFSMSKGKADLVMDLSTIQPGDDIDITVELDMPTVGWKTYVDFKYVNTPGEDVLHVFNIPITAAHKARVTATYNGATPSRTFESYWKMV